LATYRIFPSTNGPSGPVSYSGQFIAGVAFTVTKGGTWLQGFWWWVCNSGQSTGPTKMCLWSVTSPASGVVVTGTTVTSGTLTAGAWNYVALPTPVQLAIGGTYIAAIGCNGGPFPDAQGWWGTNAPNGVVNGPLLAFGPQTTTSANWWPTTPMSPYNIPQGCFTTGGTAADPTTEFPGAASSTDNFWVDVQVSDTAPPGYTGSYRLWPNRYDQGQFTGADSEVAYTVGTEVVLAQASLLDKIWYVSPSGGSPAPTIATEATVWDVATKTAVANFVSPAWQSIIGGGGSPGFGWCFVDVSASGIVLPAGTYRVTVYNGNTSSSGGPGQWSAKYLYYWGADATAGTGGAIGGGEAPNGITSGPLFAPSPLSSPPASNSFVFNDNGAGNPPYSNGALMAGQSVFAMPLGITPAVVAETDAAPTGASTTVATTPVAGHGLVLLALGTTTTQAITTFTASNGDVWELLGTYEEGGTAGDIWYCAFSLGGSSTLSLASSATGGNWRYWYQEFNLPLNDLSFYTSDASVTTIGPIPEVANGLVLVGAKSPASWPPTGLTAVGAAGSTHCAQALTTAAGTYSDTLTTTMWVGASLLFTTANSYPNLYVTNNLPSGNTAFTQNYWVDMEVTPVLSPALRSGSFLTFFS
jgi:hypothetical protein